MANKRGSKGFSTSVLDTAVNEIENFPMQIEGITHNENILGGAMAGVTLTGYDYYNTGAFTLQNLLGHTMTSLAVGSLSGATTNIVLKNPTIYDHVITKGISAAMWRLLIEVIMGYTGAIGTIKWGDAIAISAITGVGFGIGSWIYKSKLSVQNEMDK